jgi:hypothetical protein
MYVTEVWQIPTREINKILSTEMDVLRRSARKSRIKSIKNEHIKEIMRLKGKPDLIDVIEKKRLQWYDHVKRMPEERIPKFMWNGYHERKEKRTSKKNIDGRSTSSQDNKEFRTRSMEKKREMEIGFWETATAVKKTGWVDGWMNGGGDGWMDGWGVGG